MNSEKTPICMPAGLLCNPNELVCMYIMHTLFGQHVLTDASTAASSQGNKCVKLTDSQDSKT